MKKILFLIFYISGSCNLQAQSFSIQFAGSGASTTVDSVRVENLVNCTMSNLIGSDILVCNPGDTLKLTGKSGNYRTVVMLIPTYNQTVTFDFVECRDADDNNYAVLQIGDQLWMAENLKTTKYRDGSDIPNVQDSAGWHTATSGAWCDYHNLPDEGAEYGHLYNFYAVDDIRGISPEGWHVASHSECNVMEKYLDNSVDTTLLMGTGNQIGKMLKENCDTRWAYNPDTWGTNESGFTALCTNFRIGSGAWSLAPNNDHDDGFWTSTAINNGSAWFRSLRWCFSDIYVLYLQKTFGYSVRCIKNSTNTNIPDLNFQDGLKIHPNPFTDKVCIESGKNENRILQVFSLTGSCVYQSSLAGNKNQESLGFLPKGIYIAKIQGADWTRQFKLVKQ
ncbi:MAG: T9SS type A sorting domain-containing protein [Bacteroidetes bacterium]|nr:T9SS type A sorting domain-containing protein [Bacteroidota bacterium]